MLYLGVKHGHATIVVARSREAATLRSTLMGLGALGAPLACATDAFLRGVARACRLPSLWGGVPTREAAVPRRPYAGGFF